MHDVAITTVRFQSKSGDCSPELENALADLTKTIEYHAKKVAQEFGLTVDVEEQ